MPFIVLDNKISFAVLLTSTIKVSISGLPERTFYINLGLSLSLVCSSHLGKLLAKRSGSNYSDELQIKQF